MAEIPVSTVFAGAKSVYDAYQESRRPKEMLAAAEEGDTYKMKWLIIAGVPVGYSNEEGQTALHLAALNGHVGTVRALLALGAKPLALDEYNHTPLHYAVQQGDVDVVNVLCMVKKKALAVLDIDGRTALHLAALLGRTGAVVALLAADASLGAALVAQDKLGMAPLHYAAEQGDMRMVKALVRAGPAALTMPTGKGQTALHLAAFRGHTDVVDALLAADASLEAALVAHDYDGWTPLHYAAERGDVRMVKALVRAGPAALTMPARDGWTTVHMAAFQGSTDERTPLVAEDNHGWIPLQDGVEWDDVDMQQELRQTVGMFEGLALPTGGGGGQTALHLAAFRGHTEVVELLLEAITNRKADPVAQDKYGWTPLHCATANGHVAVIEALLSAGPKALTMLTGKGQTALHLAERNGHTEAVEALLSVNACILQ